MNKQTILFSILSIALLSLTACSNDNNEFKGKEVNATKSIKFKVDFADYNTEQETDATRTGRKDDEPIKLKPKTIDLGNGVLAQCTLQRDTAKQEHPTTRVIPNDTYTMLAYDAATHAFKGEVTGTVTAGAFTATSANKDIILEAGQTYDFVLFNSKVTRNNNNLIVTRTNADAALIGRTTQTINATPKKQQIAFTLKHAGAKVKIKLTGYMNFSGIKATLTSINASDVPASSVYDASTGTWSVGTGAAVSENLTYGANPQAPYSSATYTSLSNEETMFMPTTDISKLKLTFTAGNIYNIAMTNAGLTFKPSTALQLEQNGSYVLNVKLMYRFLYLMSNGDVGTIEDTPYGGNGGTKIPIAVVLSQIKGMAVALNDAGNPGSRWCIDAYNKVQTNVYLTVGSTAYRPSLSSYTKSGRDETWDASYTTSAVSGEKVKGKNPHFPAFYMAAHYNPGVIYTGSPALQWYLPSYHDWRWILSLGFGDNTAVTDSHPASAWYGNLANIAFTQVGGVGFVWSGSGFNQTGYWSSSETAGDYGSRYVGFMQCYETSLWWNYESQTRNCVGKSRVRPFVAYK